MLGIDDPQIWVAYVLCFISAIGCMVYGALKWNEEVDLDEVC
nr:symporter small accessory protein [uncultured Methanolobus sp.]